jgi:hypothetical protein
MRTFNMNEKTYPVWKNGKGYACVSILTCLLMSARTAQDASRRRSVTLGGLWVAFVPEKPLSGLESVQAAGITPSTC